MCQSGVDLAEALQDVARQCRHATLHKILDAVCRDVCGGISFSEALGRHPQAFDQTVVAGIAAAEQSGNVTAVLERLTYLLRADQRLQSTVVSMLIYPLVLCGVTFLVMNAMVFFVLPQFAQVFVDLDRPAPPFTQLLLSLGRFVKQNLPLILPGSALLAAGAWTCRRHAVVRRAWDHAVLHVVVLRQATRALITGRVFRLLGTMLESGVPLVEGIGLCRASTRNQFYRQLLTEIEQDVLRGEGLGRPLLRAAFLPAGAAQMVATAEKNGKLGGVLQSVGEYFEGEGERHLRDLVKILEPAVIVVLGVVVAAVVLSVILPLLDVSTVSH